MVTETQYPTLLFSDQLGLDAPQAIAWDALDEYPVELPGQTRFAKERLGVLVLNLGQQLVDQLDWKWVNFLLSSDTWHCRQRDIPHIAFRQRQRKAAARLQRDGALVAPLA